jgi:hypothetical protein
VKLVLCPENCETAFVANPAIRGKPKALDLDLGFRLHYSLCRWANGILEEEARRKSGVGVALGVEK